MCIRDRTLDSAAVRTSTVNQTQLNVEKIDCKNVINFCTFPNVGNIDRDTNSKTITVFGTYPNIESLMAKISDCTSFPPKANKAIYSAPAEKLNSFDLRPVSSLTAVDPCLSPETNNVIYPASNIWRPNSKNIISKSSESKDNTMEPASKNVINDMSKSAIVNNTKLFIKTDIVDTDCNGFLIFAPSLIWEKQTKIMVWTI